MEPKLEITTSNGTIVYRQDPGIPLPAHINFSGSIGAPREYADKRKAVGGFADGSSYLVVKRPESITLVTGEGTPYQGTVTGKIETHPYLSEWGINSGAMLSSVQLLGLVRPRRMHFRDPLVYEGVVDRLMQFRARIETNTEAVRDTKQGKRSDAIARKVIGMTGMDVDQAAFSFVLSMPLFRNTEPVTFVVDALVDPTDSGVRFQLDSIELRELVQKWADRYIDAELEYFRDTQIPVLEQ